MFLVSIRNSLVPKQREARLYSLSRYMNTRLRTFLAIYIQWNSIMLAHIIQKVWPMNSAISVM